MFEYVQQRPSSKLSSYYKFSKKLQEITTSHQLVYFCCERTYTEEELPPDCPDCKKKLTVNQLRRQGAYFIEPSLEELLQSVLHIPSLQDEIIDYAEHQRNDYENEVVTDIHNSEHYRKIIETCDVSEVSNKLPLLTLNINIDGVEISKSSKSSLYPLQVSINEIPPNKRASHLVVPFIYVKRDFKFDDFMLRRFTETLIELYNNGLTWRSNDGTEHITKVVVFSLNADSVQKPIHLAIPSCGGYDSCPKCLHKGEWAKKGKGGSIYFPGSSQGPQRSLVRYPDRTISSDSGPAPVLADLPLFDLIKDTSLDQMHAVDIGVFKSFYVMMFSDGTNNKDRTFFLGDKGKQYCHEIMSKFRPASFCSRGIRSPHDYKNWKAHEWREWGLFYSPVVLEYMVEKGLLEKKYYDNWLRLVIAISILNLDSITPRQLDEADRLLASWAVDFTELYYVNNYKFNFHLVVHLTASVRRLGPLWATSLFQFESNNQVLLATLRGPRHVLSQMATRLSWRHLIPQLKEDVRQKGYHQIIPLVNEVLGITPSAPFPVPKGASKTVLLNDRETSYIISFTAETHAKSYQRIAIGRSVFSTSSYADKGYDQNNSFFYSSLIGYGKIKQILKFETIPECIILYQPIISNKISIDNVTCYHGEFQGRVLNQIRAISANQITRQCITLYSNNQRFYILYKPNVIEGS